MGDYLSIHLSVIGVTVNFCLGSIHQDIAKWEQQYEDSSIHELLIHQLPKNKLALKEKHNFQRQTWNTV